MATYFTGRRELEPIVLPLDGGKTKMTCRIYEYWEDTDNTTTARCSDPGLIEVRKVVGISERDKTVIKTHIESTIGVKDFAKLKSGIEASIEKEINFSVEESTVKTSNFSSPDCGRKTMFVYQLVREYEFFYAKKFLGWTKTWERKIRERTNIHDFLPDIEDHDELCKCDNPEPPTNYNGVLVMDMGEVSMRAPFRRTPDGIEARVDNSLLKISNTDSSDFVVDIPVDALPEMVRFLGEFNSEIVRTEFHEYQSPQFVSGQSQVIGEGFSILELDSLSIEIVEDLTRYQKS